MLSKSKNQVRPARPSDVLTLIGSPLELSFRGVTAEIDGRPVGMGGIMPGPVTQAFGVFTDDLKADRRLMVQAIRTFREMLESHNGGTIYAWPSPKEQTADGFLTHVGFTKIEDGVYRWDQ
jgi:hypothetical protein